MSLEESKGVDGSDIPQRSTVVAKGVFVIGFTHLRCIICDSHVVAT